MSPGPARFCGQCGTALATDPYGHGQARTGRALEATHPTRERRQLTVVFCDLVGSTQLSARLDSEMYANLIARFFRCCSEVITRRGGFVDKDEGDAIRAYFGYPRSYDDNAVRAVHAALEVIDVVAELASSLQLPAGVSVQVRVGVNTGEAIVQGTAERTASNEPLVLGEAPNIAKRIEEAAQPGTVLVGRSTRRMAEHAFDYEDATTIALPSLGREELAYRVTGSRDSARSIDLFDHRWLAPLLGRDDELARLRQRWALADGGRGQVVLVSGEPGIGKSRLLHAFIAGAHAASSRILSVQCLEPFTHSALFPFFDILRRELEMRREDSFEERLAIVRAAVSDGRLPPPSSGNLLGSLAAMSSMAIPADTSPRLHREQLMEWLAQWILRTTDRRVLILLLEDIHWVDASSLDFLALLIDRIPSTRTLLVLSYRTGFDAPWPMRAHFTQLALSRLASDQARALVRSIAGTERFDDALVATIAQRSDGVPLYVEELTRMLVDSLPDTASRAAMDGAEDPALLSIPQTLRGSLTARLDQLTGSKPIVQVASVLGRECRHSLLRLVAGIEEGALRHALSELLDAELLFRRERGPDAIYMFKHALIQEAAYLSLLRPRRAEIHERAAMVLLEHFPDDVAQHPEVVARHFASAGLDAQAVAYWHQAGVRDLEASADSEALGHLRAALDQIARSPSRAGLVEGEVKCLVTLGSALTSVQGYAAAEVEQVFARAHDLCNALEGTEQLYAALTGLHSFYQVRGPLQRSVEIGRRLLQIAAEHADPLRRAQAHRCLGWSLFCCGELPLARAQLDAALALFDRAQARKHSRLHGAHPWVVGFVNSSLLESFGGRTALSLARSTQAIELARELGRPLGLAYALCMSAAVQCHRGDAEATLALVDELLPLAERHGMPYWSAWGRTLQGWALARQGEVAHGIAVLGDGLERYRSTGARLFEPSTLGLLAQSHLGAGDLDRAGRAIDEALSNPIGAQGYFAASELLRIRGEVWLAAREPELAVSALARAIEVARQHECHSSGLRAALRLLDAVPGAQTGLDLIQELRRMSTAIALDDPLNPDVLRARERLNAPA